MIIFNANTNTKNVYSNKAYISIPINQKPEPQPSHTYTTND